MACHPSQIFPPLSASPILSSPQSKRDDGLPFPCNIFTKFPNLKRVAVGFHYLPVFTTRNVNETAAKLFKWRSFMAETFVLITQSNIESMRSMNGLHPCDLIAAFVALNTARGIKFELEFRAKHRNYTLTTDVELTRGTLKAPDGIEISGSIDLANAAWLNTFYTRCCERRALAKSRPLHLREGGTMVGHPDYTPAAYFTVEDRWERLGETAFHTSLVAYF